MSTKISKNPPFGQNLSGFASKNPPFGQNLSLRSAPSMKQRISGKILSDKMNETVVVQVEKLKRHPKYKKMYRVSTRYKAHNEGNQYKEGEYVLLEATRPLSKEKRWRIVGKAKG